VAKRTEWMIDWQCFDQLAVFTFYTVANDRPFGLCFWASTLPYTPPRVSTMASTSQQPKGRDGALSTIDALVQVLTLAKDTCRIPPAQVAFGSAVALLTMIRVCIPLFRDYGLLTLLYLGLHDEQTRFRRPWNILRGCMSSTLPGVERETIR
jgi:hypothetical protein